MRKKTGPATRAGRPRRPLDAVRRPEILAATVDLIREHGLWSVRASDVAKRVGASEGTVFYYFGTKNQLLEQAVGDADAEFYAIVWPELDALESGIDRIAHLIVRSSTIEWVLWMDLSVYARRHPEMLAAERAFHARWCTTIAESIRRGQQCGEFKTVDPDRVALRLASLTDGLATRLVLDEDFSHADYIEHSLEAAAAELGCELAHLHAAAANTPPHPTSGD